MLDVLALLPGAATAADLAHFAAQQGAAAGAHSAFLANVAATHVTLPAGFAAQCTRELAKNSAEAGQVSVSYADDAAIAAAASGEPLPDGAAIDIEVWSARARADKKPLVGSDGKRVPERLRSVAAMARSAGRSREIPQMLRNEDWNCAIFGADRTARVDVNHAECLACHKPKTAMSYVFPHGEFAAAAARRLGPPAPARPVSASASSVDAAP